MTETSKRNEAWLAIAWVVGIACIFAGFFAGTAWERIASQRDIDGLKRELDAARADTDAALTEYANYKEGMKPVIDRWAEMHKEATGRAAMWLKKLNEEKAKNKLAESRIK
jgi:hypothetical protein